MTFDVVMSFIIFFCFPIKIAPRHVSETQCTETSTPIIITRNYSKLVLIRELKGKDCFCLFAAHKEAQMLLKCI